MSTLFLMFELRFLPFVVAILLSIAFAIALALHPVSLWLWIGFGLAFSVLAVGLYDLVQTRHAVLRNYPIAAHLRFILESVRPEMRPVFLRGREARPAVQP